MICRNAFGFLANFLAVLCVATLASRSWGGPVTYVDAVGGAGGNTVRASNESPDDWFVTDHAAADGKWDFRSAQGNSGIFQSVDSSTPDDAPELKTTAMGVANALYDVYVFFRSQDNADDWKVRAGFTSNPNANTLYGRTSAGGAIAGFPALSGIDALVWNGAAPEEDSGQPLYYAVIGQYTVTDGTLPVFIDDLPATSSSPSPLLSRTWYEGIGYAIPTPMAEINSVTSGLASAASTWSDNQAPSPFNNYHVQATHTVTLNQNFDGKSLTVESGGTLDISNTNLGVKKLVIQPNAVLTESFNGSFILGSPTDPDTPLGVLDLRENVNFDVGAGETFVIGLSVVGDKDMNINTGAGSIVRLADAENHQGTIRFNGSGDLMTLEWNKSFQRVEMNSTGANRFELLQIGSVASGTLIYNQPGVLAHKTAVTDPLSRLVNIDALEVNAPLTVEVSEPYISGANSERRLLVGATPVTTGDDLRGSGDITVQGSSSDPSNVAASVGMHSFELGSSTQPGTIESVSYSGTLTANDYVNVALRQNMRSAKIVANAHSRIETGHNITGTSKSIELGEVVVNSGGAFEVGFEDNETSSTGHQVGHVTVTQAGGRSGDLTLNAGSTLVMQVNGTAADQFDTITVEGNASLGGVLELWFNPISTNSTDNPIYTPALNDTFVIMTLTGPSLPTDFNGDHVVNGDDLTILTGAMGTTAAGDADGDGDTDGADFLLWQQTVGSSSSPGTITGNFTDVVAPGESGFAWPAGLDFTTMVSGNQVLLKVISIPAAAVVPEPSAGLLLIVGVLGLGRRRRRGA